MDDCSVKLQREREKKSRQKRTVYAQTKCKTDRRAACLGKRLFELVRLSESRCRTTVVKG